MTREPRHIHELWVRACMENGPFPRELPVENWRNRFTRVTGITPAYGIEREVNRICYAKDKAGKRRGRSDKT